MPLPACMSKVLGENGSVTGPTTAENETRCHIPGSICPAASGTGAASTDLSNVQWTAETVPGENNAYTYAGTIRDRATGEVKFGQRFYNTTTGNWTQQDALNAPLDPNNANRYEYAADNPINHLDPSGQGFLSIASDVVGGLAPLAGIAATPATGGLSDALVAGSILGGSLSTTVDVGCTIDSCD